MKSPKRNAKTSKQPKKRRQNQLERDTAAYWDNMSEGELREENELGRALAEAGKGIDFDREE
jgi:hypothetical protein